ncbi:MAG: hypothetical protein IIV65_07205 [Alistipes sp.]|nr:hypothetical protein [Alistipes sp.]
MTNLVKDFAKRASFAKFVSKNRKLILNHNSNEKTLNAPRCVLAVGGYGAEKG